MSTDNPALADWLVYSNEHSAYWRPDEKGYTTDVAQAGRYTKEHADEICQAAIPGRIGRGKPPEVAIHVDDPIVMTEAAHADQLADQLQAYVDALYDGPSNLGGIAADALQEEAVALLATHAKRRAGHVATK